jgi:hypothetical protein
VSAAGRESSVMAQHTCARHSQNDHLIDVNGSGHECASLAAGKGHGLHDATPDDSSAASAVNVQAKMLTKLA